MKNINSTLNQHAKEEDNSTKYHIKMKRSIHHVKTKMIILKKNIQSSRKKRQKETFFCVPVNILFQSRANKKHSTILIKVCSYINTLLRSQKVLPILSKLCKIVSPNKDNRSFIKTQLTALTGTVWNDTQKLRQVFGKQFIKLPKREFLTTKFKALYFRAKHVTCSARLKLGHRISIREIQYTRLTMVRQIIRNSWTGVMLVGNLLKTSKNKLLRLFKSLRKSLKSCAPRKIYRIQKP